MVIEVLEGDAVGECHEWLNASERKRSLMRCSAIAGSGSTLTG